MSNQPPLYRLMAAVQEMREVTNNPELQAQTMMTFLFVASRHPNEVAYREVEQSLNLQQTSVSRNFAYLAKGNARGHGGYELVRVEADPMYRKRLLAKLTPKGLKLAEKLQHMIGG
jgi:DNA-binding MarR family transcriptional regulator